MPDSSDTDRELQTNNKSYWTDRRPLEEPWSANKSGFAKVFDSARRTYNNTDNGENSLIATNYDREFIDMLTDQNQVIRDGISKKLNYPNNRLSGQRNSQIGFFKNNSKESLDEHSFTSKLSEIFGDRVSAASKLKICLDNKKLLKQCLDPKNSILSSVNKLSYDRTHHDDTLDGIKTNRLEMAALMNSNVFYSGINDIQNNTAAIKEIKDLDVYQSKDYKNQQRLMKKITTIREENHQKKDLEKKLTIRRQSSRKVGCQANTDRKKTPENDKGFRLQKKSTMFEYFFRNFSK